MGLFDFLKKRKNDNSLVRVVGQDYIPPIYSQFGSDIYASDVVQQAINCIVREMKKLSMQHVTKKNGDFSEVLYDDVQVVLDNPNKLMTTSDFIEKIIWQLFFNYNSFVLPEWKNGKLTGLYPLQPVSVDFLQDTTNEIFVKFVFSNGYESTIKYTDVIHIRYNYSVSEFMGGNKDGQPDNKALLKSLSLNHDLLNGVSKALKSSYAINGVIKYNTMIDGNKTEKALEELTEKLNKNENGFMPLDLKGEFIPFNRQIALVDEATLRFIDEKILRHFGVSIPILTGDYTKEQYEAFFQKTIEPLIISISQAFSKAIFSRRESFGYGHKIIFSHKLLDFMTMSEKIQFVTTASFIGGITVDEFRSMFGYTPFGGELGSTPIMSKNYGDATVVKDVDKNKKTNNNTNESEV